MNPYDRLWQQLNKTSDSHKWAVFQAILLACYDGPDDVTGLTPDRLEEWLRSKIEPE